MCKLCTAGLRCVSYWWNTIYYCAVEGQWSIRRSRCEGAESVWAGICSYMKSSYNDLNPVETYSMEFRLRKFQSKSSPWWFCVSVIEREWLQDAGQDAKFREVYDVAVARAVAEMRVLGESTLKISLFILLFLYMWFQLAFIFWLSAQRSQFSPGFLGYRFCRHFCMRKNSDHGRELILDWMPAELCLPLVRVGGIFVAAKGPNPQVCIKFFMQLHMYFQHSMCHTKHALCWKFQCEFHMLSWI